MYFSPRSKIARPFLFATAAMGVLSGLMVNIAHAGVTERLLEGQPIRLGYRPSSIPMSYLADGQQPPVGYVTDICLALVDGIKRELHLSQLPVTWVQTGNIERFEFVQQGKVDLECGLTTATAERRKKYAEFTAPHYIASMVLMTTDQQPAKHLRDLKGKTIAVQGNTTAENVIRTANSSGYDLKPLVVKSAPELLEALVNGQAQGAIEEDVILAATRAAHPQPQRFIMQSHRYTIEPLGIMYAKDDPKWMALVDRQYTRLATTGELARLYDKWFMRPIPPRGAVLNVPASRYLRESFRQPTKLEAEINMIKLQ